MHSDYVRSMLRTCYVRAHVEVSPNFTSRTVYCNHGDGMESMKWTLATRMQGHTCIIEVNSVVNCHVSRR